MGNLDYAKGKTIFCGICVLNGDNSDSDREDDTDESILENSDSEDDDDQLEKLGDFVDSLISTTKRDTPISQSKSDETAEVIARG